MVKLKRLDIVFDEHPEGSYHPGDTVSGKVILENCKDLVVKGIHAKLKGKAEVTMFVGDYDTQKECYFSEDLLLFGTTPNDPADTVNVGPGTYEYPFKYKLPLKLPNSFVCDGDENGRVVYTVEAIIHRPGKFSYSRKETFKVAAPLDLSHIPSAKVAVSGECDRVLKCMCIQLGAIRASFSLPRAGYTPGETFPIEGYVFNDSSRRIKEFYVTLVQKVTLRVYGSSVVRVVKLDKACLRDALTPGARCSFADSSMVVPEVPPSFLAGCHLMDVQYQLKLVIVPAGLWCKRLIIPLSVIIGSERGARDSAHDVTQIAVRERGGRSSVSYDFGTIV